jgi:hypothetical protein
MKGGITSGVVYPLALCRLAGHFLLQSIGGTSAGAVAAALAAAAEFGRRQQRGRGYQTLEELPRWMGDPAPDSSDSNLFCLFQPTDSTRDLFALLVAAISNPKRTLALEIILSALANRWRAAVLGALPGLSLFALLYLSLVDDSGALAIVTLVCGLVGALALSLLGAVLTTAVWLYLRAPRALRDNSFGICTGLSPEGSQPLALTNWLHMKIAEASGHELLTFGDLWQQTRGPKEIELSMITTCLTLGRPYRLPFEREDAFYFYPAELRRFLPPDVVDHMVTHADGTPQDLALFFSAETLKRITDAVGGDPEPKIYSLPPPEKLPVIFAARLSLSFPLLLSTIPLYWYSAVRDPSTGEERPSVTRCHFSDGGICSNFPIHFFDSPLPRWPTFGINLAGPIEDGIDVWMPSSNRDSQPASRRQIPSLGGFAAAIRGAMQNWRDNSYVELPGYRDRIVHVRFGPGEGGLNLNMPQSLILTLSDRGDRGARKLVSRFAGLSMPGEQPSELDWNNHRRLRQRVALTAIEEFLVHLAVGFTGDIDRVSAPRRFLPNQPMPGERTYGDLLANQATPPGYAELDDQQTTLASQLLKLVAPLATEWLQARGADAPPRQSPAMDVGGPLPPLEARIAPPL